MSVGRGAPAAVLLVDGRVLVVGTSGARPDSVVIEIWDPASGDWEKVAPLNKPREAFAAVRVLDGRVLVTGGTNQGHLSDSPDCIGDNRQSYSSTYLFDPRPSPGRWTKTGLLDAARSAPAAAVLPDGRVLVAGGYYRSGVVEGWGAVPAAELAGYQPGSADGPGASSPPPGDVSPPEIGRALATAEIFDPATGRWSATSSMRYARYAPAVTVLADGRVLVVGSSEGWDHGVAGVDAEAGDIAEIFDPATGRFSLAGRLPDFDPAALERMGIKSTLTSSPWDAGSLVALDDGGAVLIGRSDYWKHVGDASRSFRFDARTKRWSEIGQPYISIFDFSANREITTPAPDRSGAFVTRLADGRVLVAGGGDSSPSAIRSAELYDPATDTWAPLPLMPEPRAGGVAVALTDGSVLLVGGWNDEATRWAGCDKPAGLATAVRFVLGP